jgi:uncharacterized membrane protein (DUF106 family)
MAGVDNEKLRELKKIINEFDNELIETKNLMEKIEQKVRARRRE